MDALRVTAVRTKRARHFLWRLCVTFPHLLGFPALLLDLRQKKTPMARSCKPFVERPRVSDAWQFADAWFAMGERVEMLDVCFRRAGSIVGTCRRMAEMIMARS